MRKKYDFWSAIKLCDYEWKFLEYRKNHKDISLNRALRAFCEKCHVPYKLPAFEVQNARKFECFIYGLDEDFVL